MDYSDDVFHTFLGLDGVNHLAVNGTVASLPVLIHRWTILLWVWNDGKGLMTIFILGWSIPLIYPPVMRFKVCCTHNIYIYIYIYIEKINYKGEWGIVIHVNIYIFYKFYVCLLVQNRNLWQQCFQIFGEKIVNFLNIFYIQIHYLFTYLYTYIYIRWFFFLSRPLG